jgi:hypothetical protein
MGIPSSNPYWFSGWNTKFLIIDGCGSRLKVLIYELKFLNDQEEQGKLID